MRDSDKKLLLLISDYSKDIKSDFELFGKEYEQFESNNTLIHSVSMCLMQIGELSKHLSPEFQDETREHIQWGAIKGMRDWFAHGYQVMDRRTIWETASADVPVLNNFCEKMLENAKSEVVPFEISEGQSKKK